MDAAALLAWYDRHRRRLPWRTAPGETPDPYRVWLSEIMLQQTTVKAVIPYYLRFLQRWPDVHALAAAPLDDVLKAWAGLGYYARARNLHACARVIAQIRAGHFPASEKELASLPGIGSYTGAAIAAIAFGARAAAIDGNGERVLARRFAFKMEFPAAKPHIRRLAEGLLPNTRAGDFAQALMDLGSSICTPKRPACVLCPWSPCCAAYRDGTAESFPRKRPKQQGRLRTGAAFVLLCAEHSILLRNRAAKGLLGGMAEVPTSAWTHDLPEQDALAAAPRPHGTQPKWRRVRGVVSHVFTHFPLRLQVYIATVSEAARAPKGTRWVPIAHLGGEALPSLMRKVITRALDDLTRPVPPI
jgi:A/G-specific adenine glycosylase